MSRRRVDDSELADEAAVLFTRLDSLATAVRLLCTAKEEVVGDFRTAIDGVVAPQLDDLMMDVDQWKIRYEATAKVANGEVAP